MQKKGFTMPHVRVLGSNYRRNIPSDRDLQARYRLQCGYLDSFHEEFQVHIFISVGPEAKLDMLNKFYLEKPFNLYLDLPTSTHPPLCRITQQGKQPILTTDFFLTNIEPNKEIPSYPSYNE